MDNNKGKGTERMQRELADDANELLDEGKRFAKKAYKEGMNKFCEVEDELKEYSDELIKKVRQNPISSLLIAAGVGFIVSTLMKK